MPFVLPEEWEESIFNKYTFDLIIPIDDVTAYTLYKEYSYSKFYNKLILCESQDIPCVIHGQEFKFPAFSKPIYSLYGLGKHAETMTEWDESKYMGGNILMPILKGKQQSTDMIIKNGEILWSYTMTPTFIEKLPVTWSTDEFIYRGTVSEWVLKNLHEFTGVINLETIGNSIIDFHLRMSPQFVTFYGDGWLDSVISLYEKDVWDFNGAVKKGVSHVIWSDNTDSSVQIFHTSESGKRLDEIHNIGTYFRVAYINT